MGLSEGLRLARTIRHLRPSQPVHRVRLRAQRAVVRGAPGLAPRVLSEEAADAPGWPRAFRPLDATLTWPAYADLADGRLTLLGVEERLGRPVDWRPDVPQLWAFHLHYWDWAWGLTVGPDRAAAVDLFAELVTDWLDRHPLGVPGDAWSPYVASLRAWSWCGQVAALVDDPALRARLDTSLGLHAGFLRRHLERDVGGNHLLKNLKALVGLAVHLGDDALRERSMRAVLREVRRQVLPDGGHIERAPAYHCQVLGDLADVARLLGVDAPTELVAAVDRMRAFLGLVLMPDGTVPLLNDGFPVPEEVVMALGPGPPSRDGVTVLPDSGLVVLRRGPTYVLADVGLPCPDDLPAHAHADTLGFLMYAGTRRVVGERGTSTYAAGPLRDAERGTAAHSTVQVDGEDSTEVYGTFRAGRRARPTLESVLDDGVTCTLVASHDGYRHLPGRPVHRRTWQVDASGVRVRDEVAGGGRHEVTVRLVDTQGASVRHADAAFGRDTVEVAVGWGIRRQTSLLKHTSTVDLPWSTTYELEGETPR